MTCRDCKFYKRRCVDRYREMPCRGFQQAQDKPQAKQPQNNTPKANGA